MFEEFEENTTQDMEMEQQMDIIKERLIYANWDLIKNKGIDVLELKKSKELLATVHTLTLMLEYFEENEEYEKCAVINNYLKQL